MKKKFKLLNIKTAKVVTYPNFLLKATLMSQCNFLARDIYDNTNGTYKEEDIL